MNILRILIGAGLVLAILLALSLMNRGSGSCAGNCTTCALSSHCEKRDEEEIDKTNAQG